MKNVSLRQLRVFASVARHLSVARAAEELNLSPPALSMEIKELEAEVGLPLFDRTSRKVSLTTVGPAPNCYALASIAASAGSLTDAMGCAHHTVNIPFHPMFTGIRFYAQWFVFNPGANPFGIITSNGLAMLVQ